ncbi:MAG: crossover junction endodeoxyribonuclease RuvC [Rickettsiaceae bacterium]|nr:crossover junction endodeoxyribonuclease RuvC [Rickettsiaceae bacterium]
MRIIGIDPGLNNTGWAILEKSQNNIISYVRSGVLKCPAGDDMSFRLYKIFQELDSVIQLNQPKCASIEEIFVNTNAKTSLVLGFARGSILACLGKNAIPVEEYAPNTIKKTIVGHGKAHKDQVMKMLKLVIPNVTFGSNDEADAIAIAYTGLVYPKLIKP